MTRSPAYLALAARAMDARYLAATVGDVDPKRPARACAVAALRGMRQKPYGDEASSIAGFAYADFVGL